MRNTKKIKAKKKLVCAECSQTLQNTHGFNTHWANRHPSKPIPKVVFPKVKVRVTSHNKKAKQKTLVKTKRRKTNKGKILPRTTGKQRLKSMQIADKDYEKFTKTGISKSSLSYYRKQKEHLIQLPEEGLRSKYYFLQKEDDCRKTGKYREQQTKVHEIVLERKGVEKSVSMNYLRKTMLRLCREDSPAGFDPSQDKFGHCWVQKFMDRKDLSVRRATNIKKYSVFEKLHKVHRYCIIGGLNFD